MWDLSSLTRDQTRALWSACFHALEAWSLNYWTAREVPIISLLMLLFLDWRAEISLDLTHSLYVHSSPDLSKPFSSFGKRVNKSLPRSVTYPLQGQMAFHLISMTLPKDVLHATVGNAPG